MHDEYGMDKYSANCMLAKNALVYAAQSDERPGVHRYRICL